MSTSATEIEYGIWSYSTIHGHLDEDKDVVIHTHNLYLYRMLLCLPKSHPRYRPVRNISQRSAFNNLCDIYGLSVNISTHLNGHIILIPTISICLFWALLQLLAKVIQSAPPTGPVRRSRSFLIPADFPLWASQTWSRTCSRSGP